MVVGCGGGGGGWWGGAVGRNKRRLRMKEYRNRGSGERKERGRRNWMVSDVALLPVCCGLV